MGVVADIAFTPLPILRAFGGIFGANDPTLEPESLSKLRMLGYSTDEIRTWTRELREDWLNSIAKDGIPTALPADPSQRHAFTAETMSFGAQFKKQLGERTAVFLEKLKGGAPVLMVLALGIAGVALFLRIRGR